MSITIDVPPQDLAALKQLTKIDDDAQAVLQATREFVRLSGLRELKQVSGKVEFNDNWAELEQLELRESEIVK